MIEMHTTSTDKSVKTHALCWMHSDITSRVCALSGWGCYEWLACVFLNLHNGGLKYRWHHVKKLLHAYTVKYALERDGPMVGKTQFVFSNWIVWKFQMILGLVFCVAHWHFAIFSSLNIV